MTISVIKDAKECETSEFRTEEKLESHFSSVLNLA